MALMSEFKEERDAVLKHGTLKQKVAYIWEYYKWHIIIPILFIFTITYYIVDLVTSPEVILNGVMLNVYNTESENSTDILLDDFYKEQKINVKEEKIVLNTNLSYTVGNDPANYESIQILMTWLAAGNLDFITGDTSALTDLAYKEYFTDLRNYLTEEQIEKYEPYFLYMDYDFLAERSEKLNNMEDVSSMIFPDCTKPEEMVDPIPVMIDMSQSKKLTKAYGEMSDILAFSITVKETNKELTSAFLDYLME